MVDSHNGVQGDSLESLLQRHGRSSRAGADINKEGNILNSSLGSNSEITVASISEDESVN